jgi:hypothetical protein
MAERLAPTSVGERISNLPPAEFWLIDPEKKKIKTPTDSRGLVIVDELIESVKAYVDPTYKWHLRPDVHHLYWPRETYRLVDGVTDGHTPAMRFRDVCANKIYIPRDFHETIHRVTMPPAVPDAEVMLPYIDGWRIARGVFKIVQDVVQTERLSRRRVRLNSEGRRQLTADEVQAGIKITEEIIARRGKGIERHLGELVLVPEEFRPINPDLPLAQAAGQIGEMVIKGWQRQTRAVRLQTAA